MRHYHDTIRHRLKALDQPMTADQYRKTLRQLRLTQAEAAEALGISVRSSNGYANGTPIPPARVRLLRLLAQAWLPLSH